MQRTHETSTEYSPNMEYRPRTEYRPRSEYRASSANRPIRPYRTNAENTTIRTRQYRKKGSFAKFLFGTTMVTLIFFATVYVLWILLARMPEVARTTPTILGLNAANATTGTGDSSQQTLHTADARYTDSQHTRNTANTTGTQSSSDSTHNSSNATSAPLTLEFMQKSVADITNTGYLALVNHNHSAPASSTRFSPAWPTVAVSVVDGMYLHPTALQAVAQLFASARDAGYTGLFVTSGYRGVERQRQLYANSNGNGYVMPPGYSEHHTGLAADILVTGVNMSAFANTPEARWLAANSYRYGLTLRYPQHAIEITGINFEPWHFRYVGAVHAYYMERNSLVLEEYLELVRSRGEFSVEKNGTTYHILYERPQNGMLNVPRNANFSISSNNMGGYVITAWT